MGKFDDYLLEKMKPLIKEKINKEMDIIESVLTLDEMISKSEDLQKEFRDELEKIASEYHD